MPRTIRASGITAILAAMIPACTCQTTEPVADAPSRPPGLPGGDVVDRPKTGLGFLLSGADFVTMWANGGIDTRTGTRLDAAGLAFHLVPSDDMDAQVKRYVAGETPYLRATWGMTGSFYEQMCPSQEVPSCPLLVLALARSEDDVLIARESIRTVADLKGRMIGLQRGGPHTEPTFALLRAAGVGWGDAQFLWKEQLTGKGSPAEVFPTDPQLAATWALRHEVEGLLTSADGTRNHVLTDSASHPGLIVDCLFVRQDHATAHPDEVEKLRSAWLHAAAEVDALKPGTPEHDGFLADVTSAYGPAAIASPEIAKALLDGAPRLGLTANRAILDDAPDQPNHVKLGSVSRDFAEASGRPVWSWPIGVAATHWDDAAYGDLPAAP